MSPHDSADPIIDYPEIIVRKFVKLLKLHTLKKSYYYIPWYIVTLPIGDIINK